MSDTNIFTDPSNVNNDQSTIIAENEVTATNIPDILPASLSSSLNPDLQVFAPVTDFQNIQTPTEANTLEPQLQVSDVITTASTNEHINNNTTVTEVTVTGVTPTQTSSLTNEHINTNTVPVEAPVETNIQTNENNNPVINDNAENNPQTANTQEELNQTDTAKSTKRKYSKKKNEVKSTLTPTQQQKPWLFEKSNDMYINTEDFINHLAPAKAYSDLQRSSKFKRLSVFDKFVNWISGDDKEAFLEDYLSKKGQKNVLKKILKENTPVRKRVAPTVAMKPTGRLNGQPNAKSQPVLIAPKLDPDNLNIINVEPESARSGKIPKIPKSKKKAGNFNSQPDQKKSRKQTSKKAENSSNNTVINANPEQNTIQPVPQVPQVPQELDPVVNTVIPEA